VVRGRRTAIVAAAVALGAVAAPPAEATHRPKPHLRQIRCVPATACRSGVKVIIGDQIRFTGAGLYKGMRVFFRWPKGTLTFRMKAQGRAFVARVPTGTRPGRISVVVRDGKSRRSNVIHIKVRAPKKPPGPPPAATGGLPPVFAGGGMWIWELPKSEGGDVAAIAARAQAAGISTVFVKSSDGATNRWAQFNAVLVQNLHNYGLRACAWQYVYGSDPAGEARLGADAVTAGADCLVVDAEKEYEGRYAQAQQFMTALRAAVGPVYPVGLTSFPYVDYHPSLPYSVFLGPGGAQANLPQVYWKTIGGTVDAVSAHTVANNRIYGIAMAPLGQAYNSPAPDDVVRFRGLWAGYGSAGVSWWSWQSTAQPTWDALAAPAFPITSPDPGWPPLAKGSKGDQVVWLQQHLKSYDPALEVDGVFGSGVDSTLRRFQASKGLPVTGTADAATWQAVLQLAVQPVDWTAAKK
jgi:hypothetical protein